MTFNIAGVSQNNFTDNNEALLAVDPDDTYVASMNAISGQLLLTVWGSARTAGTLFGNATGGVIRYVTRVLTIEIQ